MPDRSVVSITEFSYGWNKEPGWSVYVCRSSLILAETAETLMEHEGMSDWKSSHGDGRDGNLGRLPILCHAANWLAPGHPVNHVNTIAFGNTT
jgi:hypothetical protein